MCGCGWDHHKTKSSSGWSSVCDAVFARVCGRAAISARWWLDGLCVARLTQWQQLWVGATQRTIACNNVDHPVVFACLFAVSCAKKSFSWHAAGPACSQEVYACSDGGCACSKAAEVEKCVGMITTHQENAGNLEVRGQGMRGERRRTAWQSWRGASVLAWAACRTHRFRGGSAWKSYAIGWTWCVDSSAGVSSQSRRQGLWHSFWRDSRLFSWRNGDFSCFVPSCVEFCTSFWFKMRHFVWKINMKMRV